MDEPMQFKVKEAVVDRSGIVRIHSSVYKQLGLNDENQNITIHHDDKSIIRKAFADDLVGKKDIFLRADAQDDLGIEEGETVSIQHLSSLGEEVKEDASEIKEDIFHPCYRVWSSWISCLIRCGYVICQGPCDRICCFTYCCAGALIKER